MEGEVDYFSCSPFGDPYPISQEEILNSQPLIPWTVNLDYVLCGFVRRYAFDFQRVSLAMCKYVDSILREIDNEHWNPNSFTEEACRLRWSFLDFEEYQRRQNIAKQLCALRTVFLKDSKSSRAFDAASPATREGKSTDTSPDQRSCMRTSEYKEASPNLSALGAEEFKCTIAECDTQSRIQTNGSQLADSKVGDNKFESVRNCSSSVSQERNQVELRECPSKIDHHEFLGFEDDKPYQKLITPSIQGTADQYTLDSENAKSFSSKQRELSELEKNVLQEGLEVSDFTIFSHDLKTQFEGFYDEVRSALPSMQDSTLDISDEDDSDIEPVFSNLRVDEQTGEYVGNIVRLGQSNASGASLSADAPIVPKSVPTSQISVLNKGSALSSRLSNDQIVVGAHSMNESSVENNENPSNSSEDDDTDENATTANLVTVSRNGSQPATDWRRAHSAGRESAQRGDHTAAVAQLTDAISILEISSEGPSSAVLGLMWQERAESLMAIHHFAEAAEDWRRRIGRMASESHCRDSPAAVKARLQLAISLRFTGQYLEAAQEVEKVLKVEPENQLARLVRSY